MTWDNRRISPPTLEHLVDLVMPAFRRVVAHLTRRPWKYERLATEKEIHRLWTKTEVGKAA